MDIQDIAMLTVMIVYCSAALNTRDGFATINHCYTESAQGITPGLGVELDV